jgi:hypothetical protein
MKPFKFFNKQKENDNNPYQDIVIGMIRYCNSNSMLISTFYEKIYNKTIYGVKYEFVNNGTMVHVEYMVDEGPTYERCGFIMEAQYFLSIAT